MAQAIPLRFLMFVPLTPSTSRSIPLDNIYLDR